MIRLSKETSKSVLVLEAGAYGTGQQAVGGNDYVATQFVTDPRTGKKTFVIFLVSFLCTHVKFLSVSHDRKKTSGVLKCVLKKVMWIETNRRGTKISLCSLSLPGAQKLGKPWTRYDVPIFVDTIRDAAAQLNSMIFICSHTVFESVFDIFCGR